LLEPTKIYVKSLLAAIRQTGGIKALAHITGGGFTENIPRVLPADLAAKIDLSRLKVPGVFNWLQKAGGIEQSEMLRTFNCGVGMVVAVEKSAGEVVAEVLRSHGEAVMELGQLVKRDSDAVIFDNGLKS